MWKLPTIVLVVLVTAFNAWMNWRLWRAPRPEPVAERVADLQLLGAPARVIGQREIFRPRRSVVAARPPWSDLESEDYAEYARNLRRIGCPETTVRDILVADIAHALQEQLRALRDESRDTFWQTGDQRAERERERSRREWELRLRKWSLLRELFAYPVDEEVLKIAREDGAIGAMITLLAGFMDREAFIRSFGATRYYTRQLEAVVSATEGILLESDYARARELRGQIAASVTAIIGAANVEELLLRLLAARMNSELPSAAHGFAVSGSELRQLMAIHLAALDLWSEMVADAGYPDLKPPETAGREVETAIARHLGSDRFADYLRAKDERYQKIHVFATENGLSKTEAVAVFEERARAEDEMARLHTAEDLSAEERVLLQAALKARVEATVRRVFGPLIGKEYLGDGSSSWIAEMITAPEPAKAEKEVAR